MDDRMTSKELQEIPHGEISSSFWLKEIAIQLAITNELIIPPYLRAPVKPIREPETKPFFQGSY